VASGAEHGGNLPQLDQLLQAMAYQLTGGSAIQ
jgi:hypothetical protein